MSQSTLTERLGIVGSGAIARGLAQVADQHPGVVLWARSEHSAERARERLGDHVEDIEIKKPLLGELGGLLGPDALIASTTSSLPIEQLAAASGRPDRFAGIHVFNPVTKMKLVELAFPEEASEATRRRAHELCVALDKTAVEVPNVPGFVVNRLLFPYLFSAVRLLEETGIEPEAVDKCMQLGAGHPMGPLALLDYVGLDVSTAIGEEIGEQIPAQMRELMAAGRLGKKSGAGFYDYS